MTKQTRIALLQLDEVEPVLQSRFGKLADMMKSMLAFPRFTDFHVDVFYVPAGEEPDDLRYYDGYLLTGSRSSVYEDQPWIRRLFELIRTIDELQIKTVGICFGHQAIAEALGGKVRNFHGGWGVGVHEYEVLATLRDSQDLENGTVALPCCHQDQVSELPRRATRVLTSEFCRNAGYVIDEHILALQPHPEFSVQYLEHILRAIEDRVGERTQHALESLQLSTDNSIIANLIRRFFLGHVRMSRLSSLG